MDVSATKPAKTPRLLLVDGHAYAYRAFYAIRSLHSPTGTPTNAIYGFIKMLDKMRAQLAPSHLAVVWDGGLAAERMAELPTYKEQRPPVPPDLEQQVGGIISYLEAVRYASLLREGVEADDWIAAIARRAAAHGLSVVIASSDKDFMQLVSDQIGLVNPQDKAERIWTPIDVQTKTGVQPEQIVDWLSLIGDSVDNISGVPGVGPKTAAELLKQFGSVAVLYQRLNEVKAEKLRSRLQESQELVLRNQRLVGLKDLLPSEPALDAVGVQSPDVSRLQALYAQWGFKTLLAQLESQQTVQGALL
jgi:DNA polymerase-1